MAPSEKIILDTISEVFASIWFAQKDQLSVNQVRAQAEKQLKLDDGFLKTGAWKEKSKVLIKKEAVRIRITLMFYSIISLF